MFGDGAFGELGVLLLHPTVRMTAAEAANRTAGGGIFNRMIKAPKHRSGASVYYMRQPALRDEQIRPRT